jgi:serine/threonine-protein kinase NIM1
MKIIIRKFFLFYGFLGGLLNPKVAERWSIEKIRSCSWLKNQIFNKEFDSFSSNLNNYSPSVTKTKPVRTSLEYQAHVKLEELGITSELSQTMNINSDKIRNNINGTYRIILHRLQKQSTSLERDNSYDKNLKDDIYSSYNRSISLNSDTGGRKTKQHLENSRVSHTKVCTIL